MQPQQQNQPGVPQDIPQQPVNWQQPAAPVVPSAAMPVQQDPVPPVAPPPATVQPQQPYQQPQPGTPVQQPVEALPDVEQQFQQDEAEIASDEDAELYSGDEELVRWQAAEHIHRNKTAIWYGIFSLVVVGLIAVALFLVNSITFAILIPVMAIALAVYAAHPPALLDYTLSRKGLHVNDRLYSFDSFKEFGLIHGDDENSIMLVPRKRFQPGLTIYFPEDAGEAIVDMLAARLPMREVRLDPIDRLIRRLHI